MFMDKIAMNHRITGPPIFRQKKADLDWFGPGATITNTMMERNNIKIMQVVQNEEILRMRSMMMTTMKDIDISIPLVDTTIPSWALRDPPNSAAQGWSELQIWPQLGS